MKDTTNTALLFFFGMIFGSVVYAQELEPPTDDLGNVSDAFQENFFEALKQKGIENYELALTALDKAERAAKEDEESKAVVYFEMGKNLTQLRRFEEAESNFQKVLDKQGDRLDVMEALYDLYYQKKDYEAAIPLVQRLIQQDPDYKEDLANLYSRTQQYDKALALLDELDVLWGVSDYRDVLRSNIYRLTGNTSGEIEKLEERIDANPKKEQDYLNLIFLYSEQGNTAKAFETAKMLLKNQPTSELVHLALYKFYLDEGNSAEAIVSMKNVFQSSKIDQENKYKVLADFLQFVKTNPEHEAELESIVSLFAQENNGKVYEQLGNYYAVKNMKEQALLFYEKGVANDTDNYTLVKNTLLMQIDVKKYEEALQLSNTALEIFPAQPLLYLLNGVSNIGVQNADAAIESLETGVDYLLDDPDMERDFYKQLNLAYLQKGDQNKADFYAQKAANLPDGRQ